MISGLTADAVAESERVVIPVDIRKARMSDIAPLLELINGYASRGIMLPRTEFEISESIRDFSVAYAHGRLVGCGALHFYSPIAGEIRSLAVEQSVKTHGVVATWSKHCSQKPPNMHSTPSSLLLTFPIFSAKWASREWNEERYRSRPGKIVSVAPSFNVVTKSPWFGYSARTLGIIYPTMGGCDHP